MDFLMLNGKGKVHKSNYKSVPISTQCGWPIGIKITVVPQGKIQEFTDRLCSKCFKVPNTLPIKESK